MARLCGQRLWILHSVQNDTSARLPVFSSATPHFPIPCLASIIDPMNETIPLR